MHRVNLFLHTFAAHFTLGWKKTGLRRGGGGVGAPFPDRTPQPLLQEARTTAPTTPVRKPFFTLPFQMHGAKEVIHFLRSEFFFFA